MDGLKSDDKTICNFRKDNAKALRQMLREFSEMGRELGLYGGKIVEIDRTKIRANNSRRNNHNQISVSENFLV